MKLPNPLNNNNSSVISTQTPTARDVAVTTDTPSKKGWCLC